MFASEQLPHCEITEARSSTFFLNWWNIKELSAFIFTLNRAGGGPQMLQEIQCFSGLPTHSCPFLLQDAWSLHHPRGTFISEWSAASPKTLKGCFVSLSPQTPWTRRLPSSHRYLFTVAYICMSLSQPSETHCAEWVPARARIRKSTVYQDHHFANSFLFTITVEVVQFTRQVIVKVLLYLFGWKKVGLCSCQ